MQRHADLMQPDSGVGAAREAAPPPSNQEAPSLQSLVAAARRRPNAEAARSERSVTFVDEEPALSMQASTPQPAPSAAGRPWSAVDMQGASSRPTPESSGPAIFSADDVDAFMKGDGPVPSPIFGGTSLLLSGGPKSGQVQRLARPSGLGAAAPSVVVASKAIATSAPPALTDAPALSPVAPYRYALAPEVLFGPVSSGKESKAMRQRREAAALCDCVGYARFRLGASSSVMLTTPAERREVVIQQVAASGGQTGGANRQLRLFFKDYEAALLLGDAARQMAIAAAAGWGVEIFPISIADAVAARSKFTASSARNRVATCLERAKELGLPVEHNELDLATGVARTAAPPPSGPKAPRDPPSPLVVAALEVFCHSASLLPQYYALGSTVAADGTPLEPIPPTEAGAASFYGCAKRLATGADPAQRAVFGRQPLVINARSLFLGCCMAHRGDDNKMARILVPSAALVAAGWPPSVVQEHEACYKGYSQGDADGPGQVVTLCVSLDKNAREGVMHYMPAAPLMCPDIGVEWLGPHSVQLAGCAYMAVDSAAKGAGVGPDPSVVPASVVEGVLQVSYMKDRSYKASMERVLSVITNTLPKGLGDKGLSGTHLFRFFPPYVAWCLGWSRFERDALGDWAPGVAADHVAGVKRSRKASVSIRHYVPNAERHEQLEIRGRFQAAVACAVLLNGTVSALTPETTWKDLFPDTVEDDSPLSKFYGPLDKYAHRAE